MLDHAAIVDISDGVLFCSFFISVSERICSSLNHSGKLRSEQQKSNMCSIFSTLDTSQPPRSQLNLAQKTNMYFMLVTLLVSHSLILMFRITGIFIPQNKNDMSVTLDVSMKFRSASGPCRSSSSIIMDLSSSFVLGLVTDLALALIVVDVMCNGIDVQSLKLGCSSYIDDIFVQPKNMSSALLTFETSQDDRLQLNFLQHQNIQYIISTLDTFHIDKSDVKR